MPDKYDALKLENQLCFPLYACSKEIVRKAGEDADNQIQERRNAAQSELDGLAKRIAELQSREATITQRVSVAAIHAL